MHHGALRLVEPLRLSCSRQAISSAQARRTTAEGHQRNIAVSRLGRVSSNESSPLGLRPGHVTRSRDAARGVIIGPSLIRGYRGERHGHAALPHLRLTSRAGPNGHAAIADSRLTGRRGQTRFTAEGKSSDLGRISQQRRVA